MPRIAILSDIHSNWPAFSAVLLELDRSKDYDVILFGGDIVGYGASPNRCVDTVRALGAGACVLGNHEHLLNLISSGYINEDEFSRSNAVEAGILHSLNQLGEENLQWCRGLPLILRIDEKTILAHSSLHEPALWHYVTDEEAAAPTLDLMRERELAVSFFGHVHRLAVFPPCEPDGQGRFKLEAGSPRAVTVGSVGQPREKDSRSSWVMLDTDEGYFEFRRTEYDNLRAAREILEAGLPQSSAKRLL